MPPTWPSIEQSNSGAIEWRLLVSPITPKQRICIRSGNASTCHAAKIRQNPISVLCL